MGCSTLAYLPSRAISAYNKAINRPELDFDYLLDRDNLETIRQNIKSRKGVGNVDRLHKLWSEIQEYGKREYRSAAEYEKLWDSVSTFSSVQIYRGIRYLDHAQIMSLFFFLFNSFVGESFVAVLLDFVRNSKHLFRRNA